MFVFSRLLLVAVIGLTAVSGTVSAEVNPGYKGFVKEAKFDDVLEDLREAIVKRGFVIDYVGHFNAMLERTAETAGSVTAQGVKSPYTNAQYLQFCPSKLTHEAVSANPFGIANCPISLFIFELRYEPGKVHVGYRLPLDSPSRMVKEVNGRLTKLLDEIAGEAVK